LNGLLELSSLTLRRLVGRTADQGIIHCIVRMELGRKGMQSVGTVGKDGAAASDR
jgi:hypothetical protein